MYLLFLVRMLMIFKLVLVRMYIAVTTVRVQVGMDVLMFMSMNRISVSVFVGVNMFVLVGMLQSDRILNHKIGADGHNDKRNIKLNSRSFS